MQTTHVLLLLFAVFTLMMLFVLYPHKKQVRCQQITPSEPIVPPKPQPPSPDPQPTPDKGLIPKDSVGIATNNCGNIFFYGASTKKPTSISGYMTINDGSPIKLTITGPGSGSLSPYIYNPSYDYGWDALWNTPVKLNDKICCNITLKAGTETQKISKCLVIKNCHIDGIIWGYGK